MYLISSEKAIRPGHLLGVYEIKIFLCENYSLSVSYVKDLGTGPTPLLFIFLISTSCITIVGIYIFPWIHKLRSRVFLRNLVWLPEYLSISKCKLGAVNPDCGSTFILRTPLFHHQAVHLKQYGALVNSYMQQQDYMQNRPGLILVFSVDWKGAQIMEQ